MSTDWYARRLAKEGVVPAPTYRKPEILSQQQAEAPMRGNQPPVAPPPAEGSMSSALGGGDAQGGARTQALAAKGRCPSCGSVNYYDDPNTSTSAHCFECNYSPRLGNALSAE